MKWGSLEYVLEQRERRVREREESTLKLAEIIIRAGEEGKRAAFNLLALATLPDEELQRVGWSGISSAIEGVRSLFSPLEAETIIGIYSEKRGNDAMKKIGNQYGLPSGFKKK